MRILMWLVIPGLIFSAKVRGDEKDDLKPIIDKAVKAAGGEKLTGLKAYTWTFRSKRTDGGMFVTREFVQLPDRYRSEVENEQNKGKPLVTVTVLAGDKGWSGDGVGGLFEMNAEGVALQKRRLTTTGVLRVLTLTHPEYKLSSLGESKHLDRTVVGIKATRETDEQRLFLDKENGRLLKIEYRSGPNAGSERLYDAFKEGEEITMPRKWVVRLDGKVFSEFEVVEFKVADKLDAKLFEKP